MTRNDGVCRCQCLLKDLLQLLEASCNRTVTPRYSPINKWAQGIVYGAQLVDQILSIIGDSSARLLRCENDDPDQYTDDCICETVSHVSPGHFFLRSRAGVKFIPSPSKYLRDVRCWKTEVRLDRSEERRVGKECRFLW